MVLRSFFIILILFSCITVKAFDKPVNFLQTSEDFITAISKNEDIDAYIEVLKVANIDELSLQLGTDFQKITFWINIYNAFIQHILTIDPKKYEDRSKFFKEKQINIGGNMMSFADIEHGIIRGSQHEYFLGYMKKWFPSKLEKKLRVKKRDYRIHFALNCGAKSCPPVAIYNIDRINEQLNISTKKYLDAQTTFDETTKTAYTTSLFSWFRGDFGGKKGVRNILTDLGLIPNNKIKYKTTDYDWTLLLGNFIEI